MAGKPNKVELPVSSQGVPKRAGPWLAAAMPHLAELTDFLSSGTVEAGKGVHTSFRIEMEKGGIEGNAKMASITVVLRLFMAELGSGLRLENWDAVRKHLTPAWWKNTAKGGNKDKDFSQTYVENFAGSFAAQAQLLSAYTKDGRTGLQILEGAVHQFQLRGLGSSLDVPSASFPAEVQLPASTSAEKMAMQATAAAKISMGGEGKDRVVGSSGWGGLDTFDIFGVPYKLEAESVQLSEFASVRSGAVDVGHEPPLGVPSAVLVKSVRTGQLQDAELEMQREELAQLTRATAHRNFLRVFDYSDGAGLAGQMRICLEYAQGFEYFGWARDQKATLPEDDLRSVACQLAGMFQHCHDHGVHSVKVLGNLLLDSSARQPQVRMIGWGVSTDRSASLLRLRPDDDYMPPELSNPKLQTVPALHLGKVADVWSLGVCFFVLVCRQFPFGDPRPAQDSAVLTAEAAAAACELRDRIQTGRYRDPDVLAHSSCLSQLRELLTGMLSSAPSARPRLAEVLACCQDSSVAWTASDHGRSGNVDDWRHGGARKSGGSSAGSVDSLKMVDELKGSLSKISISTTGTLDGMDLDEIAAHLPGRETMGTSIGLDDMIANHLPSLPMSTSTETLLNDASASSSHAQPASSAADRSGAGARVGVDFPQFGSDTPPVLLGDALEFPSIDGFGDAVAGSVMARDRDGERPHLPSAQSMELMQMLGADDGSRLERQRSDKSDKSDCSGFSGIEAMGFLQRDDSFGSLDLKLSDTARSSGGSSTGGLMKTSSSSNGDGAPSMAPAPPIGDSFNGVGVDVSGRDLLNGVGGSVEVDEEWVKIG